MKCCPTNAWFPLVIVGLVACREKGSGGTDSGGKSLPPVYSLGPAGKTNWNADAGPVMIAFTGSTGDTVDVVFPEATDSTIAFFERIVPPISGLTFDLFGRGGKVKSSVSALPLPPADTDEECHFWPLAKLRSARANWRVGFASGHVNAIKVDSIEGMSSTDSAALAASLARTAATLPVAADPTFRGLPFRVRSAFTFRLDSVDVVVADVVRSVNEEANPRLEHILIVGEKAASTLGKYNVGYYSRTAGAEESTQATEVLTMVQIGAAKRPAIVVDIEYDDASKLGLIERMADGQWRATWRSAYTDC
ncbi:MAG: hypothetical protein DMD30_07890 [Gemmatimonadetes bacterium]|nr:MAG: hypothetical protein DMD30_07890 [Gemmatimonadota bacterium]